MTPRRVCSQNKCKATAYSAMPFLYAFNYRLSISFSHNFVHVPRSCYRTVLRRTFHSKRTLFSQSVNVDWVSRTCVVLWWIHTYARLCVVRPPSSSSRVAFWRNSSRGVSQVPCRRNTLTHIGLDIRNTIRKRFDAFLLLLLSRSALVSIGLLSKKHKTLRCVNSFWSLPFRDSARIVWDCSSDLISKLGTFVFGSKDSLKN